MNEEEQDSPLDEPVSGLRGRMEWFKHGARHFLPLRAKEPSWDRRGVSANIPQASAGDSEVFRFTWVLELLLIPVYSVGRGKRVGDEAEVMSA